MSPKMKALPPSSEGPTIEAALDGAMECLSLAAKLTMDRREDAHRFRDVERLAVLAQAVGRLRARHRQRVRDYVTPEHLLHRQRRGATRHNNGPEYGGLGGLGAPRDMERVEALMEDLADEQEDDAQADAEGPQRRARRHRPGNGCVPNVGAGLLRAPNPWIGAPRGVGAEDVDETVQQAAAVFTPLFEQLGRDAKRRADAEERQADMDQVINTAQELQHLFTARYDAKDEEELAVVQARIDELLEVLATRREREAPPPAAAPEESPPSVAPAPAPLQIRCTACENLKGRHWITAEGIPRPCDICNAEMTLEVVPSADQNYPTPRPPVAQGAV